MSELGSPPQKSQPVPAGITFSSRPRYPSLRASLPVSPHQGGGGGSQMHIRLQTGCLISELLLVPPQSPPCLLTYLPWDTKKGIERKWVFVWEGSSVKCLPSLRTQAEKVWKMWPTSAAVWRASLLWGSLFLQP